MPACAPGLHTQLPWADRRAISMQHALWRGRSCRSGGASVFWVTAVWLVLLAALAVPASGRWERLNAEKRERLCKDLRLCTTKSHHTWSTASTYDSKSGCALLKRKGIRQLYLYGDSFMRHLYIGISLTLSGNHKDGALQEGVRDCDYNAQFEEKRCRLLMRGDYNEVPLQELQEGVLCVNDKFDGKCRLLLRLTSTLCDGAVRLVYHQKPEQPPVDAVCASPPLDTLVLYTIGNHALDGDYGTFWGQTAPQRVQSHVDFFQRSALCQFAAQHPATCRLWWVSTHQRLNHVNHPGIPQENLDLTAEFNAGMREYFESGRCGPAHVVDVFNMTHELVTQLPGEAQSLTHDGVHWSLVINLLKTQVLFNDMEASLPTAQAVVHTIA